MDIGLFARSPNLSPVQFDRLPERIATRLAAAGDSVCIADIDGATAASTAAHIGRGACSVAVDITNSESVARAVASLLEQNKVIDILVNNAGLAGKAAAPIWEQTAADWQK